MSVDWRTTHWFELLGSWHDTWHDLSLLLGHALVRFIDAPMVWHCTVYPYPINTTHIETTKRTTHD